MRVEFPQGLPADCTEWLNKHVGKGNTIVNNIYSRKDRPDYDWFYKHERVYPQPHEAFDPRDLGPKYLPTVTVKDPKLAAWFILRWS